MMLCLRWSSCSWSCFNYNRSCMLLLFLNWMIPWKILNDLIKVYLNLDRRPVNMCNRLLPLFCLSMRPMFWLCVRPMFWLCVRPLCVPDDRVRIGLLRMEDRGRYTSRYPSCLDNGPTRH